MLAVGEQETPWQTVALWDKLQRTSVTDFMTCVAYFSRAAEKGRNLKPSETAYATALCVQQKQISRWHFLSLIDEAP